MELIGVLFFAAIIAFAILRRRKRTHRRRPRAATHPYGLRRPPTPPPPAGLPIPRAPAPRPTDLLPPPTELHPVTKVVDGDTFYVDFYGQARGVRIIGMDTPETVHPDRGVEFYGPEASAEAKRLLTNGYVALFTDPTQGEQDHYGRWLYYVVLPDGTDFGEHMIRHGFAKVYRFKTDFLLLHKYLAAQDDARTRLAGLWAAHR